MNVSNPTMIIHQPILPQGGDEIYCFEDLLDSCLLDYHSDYYDVHLMAIETGNGSTHRVHKDEKFLHYCVKSYRGIENNKLFLHFRLDWFSNSNLLTEWISAENLRLY